MKQPENMIERLHSAADVIRLFPQSVKEIKDNTAQYLADARRALDEVIAADDAQRTFANTVQAIDFIGCLSNLAIHDNLVGLVKELYPDDALRQAAQDATQEIQAFWIESVSDNKKVYEAFKAYVEGNGTKEILSPAQQYYISESMKSFKRAGLDLPDDVRSQLTILKKELADLALQFETNIAQDASTIAVVREGLQGLDDDFIATLKQNDQGAYILGVDYPTVSMVMQNCAVADTRQALKIAFDNRAYPANEAVLKSIIAKRDQLAKILGFESYAALQLSSQMSGSVDRVQTFLEDLRARSGRKVDQEMNDLIAQLPAGVTLTVDGKIKPWDVAFLQAEYKKKHLSLDERVISQYFPVQKTIDGLFSIYEKFFSIQFKQVPAPGTWHEDVRLVEVYSADGSVLHGYIFLDLYPRPNKYSHAAHGSIVPATMHQGTWIPSVSLVMANFPKATADKPALFMRNDVSTFFHEFGHALHAMLGRTELAGQAGTHVKRDFVELPSQILEEWLWDRQILKMVSGHYKTGEPLPDELIDSILTLKTFDTGNFVQRQVMLSVVALNYYLNGADKDLYALLRNANMTYRPQVAWHEQDHFYVSWGHLTGYAAGYYGYLWSRVFAQDVFEQIKEYGLLNPEIGKKYSDMIIGRGGSADPNELLRDFLGREPRSDAFFRDLGLN